ncbi:hypothetical protein LguiA_013876 [Lonicera macranthoides]
MMEKADPTQKLHTRMRLWEFPDQYVVEPTDGSSGSCLAISRLDGSMKLVDDIPHCSSLRVPKLRTVYGIIGLLKLLAGTYVLVITERESVGSYLGHPIFKVSSMKIFPCDHSVKNSSAEQKKLESEFSELLKVAEKSPGLYFSYDVNLTLSAQRLHDLGDESKLLPLWRQARKADPRFLWNNYMLEMLIDNKLDPYLLPVMQGSFNHFQAAIGKDIVDVTLIARRCTRRIGEINDYEDDEDLDQDLQAKDVCITIFLEHICTRMWRRGADSDGYVANFVESEQIVQVKGFTASLVQVRGSIPFLWEQIVDLTYKPKYEIVRVEEAARVAERHFLDLRKKYGNVVAIDLINKHGGEGRLNEKFVDAMQHISSDEVRYVHFDFHGICGHVHFERLSILYEQIEDFIIKNRYLLLNEKGEKVESQTGVVRTNCIDCLDRTNVTQSMIGRRLLEIQLRRLGLFDADETINSHPNFDDSFKIIWANHGDDISIQYSGTPALKGDFVRYGQRTLQGIGQDGFNALMRYYLNNFRDGTKQDAIDLLQGHYIVSVSRDMNPPSQKGGIEAVALKLLGEMVLNMVSEVGSLGGPRFKPWHLHPPSIKPTLYVQNFPVAFSIIMIGFFFAFLSLRQVRYDLWHLLFSMMWAGMSLGIAAVVKANGRIFCNRPRLHKPRR